MATYTVAEVFEIAIATEQAAERLFLGLQACFSSHADLAQFWGQFARDEGRHAEWLQALHERVAAETPAALARPVDAKTAAMVHAIAQFSVEQALECVYNLEDAFELASGIESGETNAVFQYLVNKFETDDQKRSFLRSQVEKHVSALVLKQPEAYRSVFIRRSIPAIKPDSATS